MGVVYLARDPVLERDVAIKLLPPEQATAVAIERFILESKLLARLTHPHIVAILDARHVDQLLWFVMPYLGDETLATRLRSGAMTPVAVQRLGLELLDALDHAHRSGVVHRDIKPGNIFVRDEHALLADFGVAALRASAGETLTATGQVVGTVRYMSPEQRTGSDASARSDIYSLGATLFEASTGKPWDVAYSYDRHVWRFVPPLLRPAVHRALQPDPARRWESALAFRDALTAAPGRHRAFRIALPVAAAALALAAFGVLRGRAGAAAPRSARDGLSVLRFVGADDSVASDLTQRTVLPLEWFPPMRVMSLPSSDTMSLGGAMSRSEFVATGAVRLTQDGAGVVDVMVRDSAGHLHDQFAVPGSVSDREGWGRAIARALVGKLLPASALGEFDQLGGVCRSMAALNDYFDGERQFQREAWLDAETLFRQAQEQDSTCLPAAWGEVLARKWRGKQTDLQLAALDAHAALLPELLKSVVSIQRDLDLPRRMARYDSLASGAPHFALGRQLRANDLFSRGALNGVSLRTGIAALQSAAAELRGSDRVDIYTHIVWGAVRLGDLELAQSQFAVRRGLAPRGDKWGSLLRLAIAGRFGKWTAGPMRMLLLLTADSATYAELAEYARFGLELDDPADQEILCRALAHHARTPAGRASAFSGLATAMLLQGRPLAALARLDSAAASTPGDSELQLQRREWRLALPLAGVSIPADQQRSARAELEAGGIDGARSARAHWILAVDAATRGDSEVFRRHRGALQDLAPGIAVAGELGAYADAWMLGTRGALDSALAVSGRIHQLRPDSESLDRGPVVRALVYLRRGEWQRAGGHPAAAEREWIWHENNDLHGRPMGPTQEGEFDAAVSGVARVLRGDNLRAQGDTTLACPLYRRAVELWRGAEPGFSGWRQRAALGARACSRAA